jgi:hypothetical protein
VCVLASILFYLNKHRSHNLARARRVRRPEHGTKTHTLLARTP